MSEVVFGFVGVILGSVISIFGSWLLARCKLERDARYLASRIICQLDRYVSCCEHVVHDYGPGEPDDKNVPDKSRPPPPVYPSDVNWSSIDCKLMYRILILTNTAEHNDILVHIAFSGSHPPDYEEGIEERQLRYSKLGLEACEIIEILKDTYKVPHESIDELYGKPSQVIFQEKIDEIKKKRSQTA